MGRNLPSTALMEQEPKGLINGLFEVCTLRLCGDFGNRWRDSAIQKLIAQVTSAIE